jgi:hypothetical protein
MLSIRQANNNCSGEWIRIPRGGVGFASPQVGEGSTTLALEDLRLARTSAEELAWIRVQKVVAPMSTNFRSVHGSLRPPAAARVGQR